MGIPDDQADGGPKIARLAKHKVHVLYTTSDRALLFRQTWHRFRGVQTSALGRCAGHAMNEVHPALKEKIVFHNCAYMQQFGGLHHSYQDSEKAMHYYENSKPNDIQKKAFFLSV